MLVTAIVYAAGRIHESAKVNNFIVIVKVSIVMIFIFVSRASEKGIATTIPTTPTRSHDVGVSASKSRTTINRVKSTNPANINAGTSDIST